jgi:hypothetical protein
LAFGGLNFLDRLRNRPRVGVSRHRLRLRINTLPDFGTVSPQLLDQRNELRRFLFTQNGDLQRHLVSKSGQSIGTPLGRKDQGSHVQHHQCDVSFQPGEWGRQ